jgi:hypothetical protein
MTPTTDMEKPRSARPARTGSPTRASARRGRRRPAALTCTAVERRLATAVDEGRAACLRASSPLGACAVGWTSGVRGVCVGPKTLSERRRYASTTPIVPRLAPDRPGAESDRRSDWAGQTCTAETHGCTSTADASHSGVQRLGSDQTVSRSLCNLPSTLARPGRVRIIATDACFDSVGSWSLVNDCLPLLDAREPDLRAHPMFVVRRDTGRTPASPP